MNPRPFQRAAMARCGDEFRSGKRAIVLVSPTGSGKSCMGAMMAAELVKAGKRVAWGAHREELLQQAATTLRSFGLHVSVRGSSYSAPVQIDTFQAWVARGVAPDAHFFFPDECHHLADKTGWTQLQRGYMQSGARVLGLTATPARGDGQALSEFDGIVVAAQIAELQALGLLVPLRIKAPANALESGKIAQRPVDVYQEHAVGQSTVVFSPHVRAAERVVSEFEAAGVRAKLVTGTMPKGDRADILHRFAIGDLPVVVNVNVLTEGWDAPRAACCIVARGCNSQGLWVQIAGRILRPWCICGKLKAGEPCSCAKPDALLVNLRGITHELGRPDADRAYHLEGEGITVAERPVLKDRLCSRCHAPLGDSPVCLECGKGHETVIPKVVGAELIEMQAKREAAKEILKPSKSSCHSLASWPRRSSPRVLATRGSMARWACASRTSSSVVHTRVR